MKKKFNYYAMLYKGDPCTAQFVKCFIPYPSLNRIFLVCNSALSTLFAIGETGFLKVYRDKEFIGTYSYNEDSNTFTFISNNIFPNSSNYLKQILKKNERSKQKNYCGNT